MARIRFSDQDPARITRRLSEIRAEERARARVFWGSIGSIVGFVVVGLVLMAVGLVSSSPAWGPVAFWSGVVAADLGIASTIAWAFLNGEP